jgi:hypothetical protein
MIGKPLLYRVKMEFQGGWPREKSLGRASFFEEEKG